MVINSMNQEENYRKRKNDCITHNASIPKPKKKEVKLSEYNQVIIPVPTLEESWRGMIELNLKRLSESIRMKEIIKNKDNRNIVKKVPDLTIIPYKKIIKLKHNEIMQFVKERLKCDDNFCSNFFNIDGSVYNWNSFINLRKCIDKIINKYGYEMYIETIEFKVKNLSDIKDIMSHGLEQKYYNVKFILSDEVNKNNEKPSVKWIKHLINNIPLSPTTLYEVSQITKIITERKSIQKYSISECRILQ